MKKCPLLKQSVYEAHGMTGNGYPAEWVEFVHFEDCIGEECMFFYQDNVYSAEAKDYVKKDQCTLMNKK